MNFSNINICNQSKKLLNKTADIKSLVQQYADNINLPSEVVFTSFAKNTEEKDTKWIDQNDAKFLHNTPNTNRGNVYYLSECGFVYCMIYTPDGQNLIVGHSTGLIQMRHGSTGAVLSTLRNVQFPPRPVYALYYSRTEENVCYAACMDGVVYRIDIPHIKCSTDTPPEYCIKADPALESLHTQFYGSPGIISLAAPFVTSRSPALCLGVLEANKKLIVGYADASVKVFDMETQEVEETYKVHKLRLQFIVKKLQRMHAGQVCALKCHEERPCTFATGAWDNTIRIWDTRCKVGCMMTFEGVNVCSDSIDLNRDHCMAGSWQPTEALTVWDLAAKRRLSIVRVQNRRPDIDGEYIYACRYWRSSQYNRKGKYGIIGGSGTGCVEVINLHNRYISASYAVPGSILAVTSHGERIAFGGTAPVISIASFHDPKHEQYDKESEDSFDLVWDSWNRSSVDANYDESKDANISESKDPNMQEEDLIKRLRISELEDQVIEYGEKME